MNSPFQLQPLCIFPGLPHHLTNNVTSRGGAWVLIKIKGTNDTLKHNIWVLCNSCGGEKKLYNISDYFSLRAFFFFLGFLFCFLFNRVWVLFHCLEIFRRAQGFFGVIWLCSCCLSLACLVGWFVGFSETGSLYVTLAVLEPIL